MNKVLFGDCRETMKTLEDKSIQMCVTSPPYYGLRDYLENLPGRQMKTDLFSDDSKSAPMTLDQKVQQGLEIIDKAITLYKPILTVGLFSGGHDSRVACEIASMHPSFNFIAHINTGIGIDETRDYVIESCENKHWQLKEYHPPVSYSAICEQNGMPGPGSHRYCYIRLKERCLQQLLRDHKTKRNQRIMLITGVRLSESTRRMGHVVDIQKQGAMIWTAPIINFTNDDKDQFMLERGINRNPVVDLINMSGECLCGSFAKNGELNLIAENFPATASKIYSVQNICAAKGKHAKWGIRPPLTNKSGMHLCFSCEAK